MVEVVYAAGTEVLVDWASAMGQTVVYNATVSVVTFPMRAGQSVTLGAQEVMVYTDVV